MPTANYTSANTLRGNKWHIWVEIAGLPVGYGTEALASSYFSARAAASQPSQVKALLMGPPHVADQVLRLLEGRTEMSDLSFAVLNDAGELDSLLATNRTTNWLYLAADITAAAASLTYDDPDSVDGNWPASGQIYLDNETINYTTIDTGTNTISGLTRGYYSSVAEAHTGRTTKGEGALMSTYHTHLIGRRVFCYLGYYDSGGARLDDADKLALPFGGYIDDWSWDDDLESVTFRCGNGLSDLHQPALQGKFGEWRLSAPGIGGLGPIARRTVLEAAGLPGVYRDDRTVLMQQINPDVRTAPAENSNFFVRIDDEILLLSARTTTTGNVKLWFYRIVGRGLFATVRSVHAQGATVREVIPVVGADANGSLERIYSEFSAGDNVLQILLQFMLSKTGDGSNDATYDVLPDGWGLGIPAARMDKAGIENLFKANNEAWAAGLAFRTILTGPIDDFYEWAVKNIFGPYGLYPFIKLGDTISVGSIRPYTPLVTASVTVNNDELLARPQVQAGLGETVGNIIMRADWNPLTEKFESTINATITNAWIGSRKNAGRYRSIVYESVGLRTESGAWFSSGYDSMSDAQIAEIVRSRMQDSYGRPEPTFKIRVHITFHSTVEIGDFVTVTLPSAPNPESTARGITAETYQIVGKQIQLDGPEASVELTIRKPTVRRYRLWSPALNVTAFANDTPSAGKSRLTVSAARYAATGNDTDAFTINDVVRVYHPQRTSRSATAVVEAKTATTVDLNKNAAALGVTPAADWQVLPADFTEALAAQTTKFAWGVAGSGAPTLGTGRPHEYA